MKEHNDVVIKRLIIIITIKQDRIVRFQWETSSDAYSEPTFQFATQRLVSVAPWGQFPFYWDSGTWAEGLDGERAQLIDFLSTLSCCCKKLL